MSEDDIQGSAKKFAAQFSGFLKACEMLGKIENIEKAAKEAQGRLDALRRDEQEMADKQAKALAAERAKIVAAVERDRQQAKEILEAARNEAQRIKLGAQQEAEREAVGIIEQAKQLAADAQTTLNGLQAQMQSVRGTMGDLQNSINERKQELVDINNQIREATGKRSAAERKLEELRSALN